jgi:hypothetical protein
VDAQETRFFRIGSGPTESIYFQIASLIGNVVSSPPGGRDCDRGGSCGVPGLIALTQTTAGSVANVEAIGAKRFESGLSQADIAYWAFHGTGPQRPLGAVTNLRAIANLYPEILHVAVRRRDGIKDLRQLVGKAVSLGERDSGTLVTAQTILQDLGIAERDLRAQYLKPGEAGDALRDGRIDAYFEMSGVPSPTLHDIAEAVEIDLVPIGGAVARRLRGDHPFFTETVVPGDAYRGVPETPSVSVGVLWIVGAEVDEGVVHGLTRALWHPNNRRALDNGHAFGRLIRRENALEGVGLELHPGAALYYFEAGMIR